VSWIKRFENSAIRKLQWKMQLHEIHGIPDGPIKSVANSVIKGKGTAPFVLEFVLE
jgi:hypothetical protein